MDERCEAPARTLRAAGFAAVAVTLLLALRARSDGAGPPLLVVVSSFGLLAALARTLSARERSWSMLFSALVATQLALHVAFLFASTGQLAHAGNAGLFCSPPSASGGGCLPTERGGWVLLAVQLLAAAVFTCWMRGAESASWQLARQTLGALVGAVRQLAVTLLRVLVAISPVAPILLLSQGESLPRPCRLLFVREHGRRGPPRRHQVDPSSTSLASMALAFGF